MRSISSPQGYFQHRLSHEKRQYTPTKVLIKSEIGNTRVTEYLHWIRYQRKRIKAGALPEEQRLLFEDLAASRSTEHTGGRRKRNET